MMYRTKCELEGTKYYCAAYRLNRGSRADSYRVCVLDEDDRRCEHDFPVLAIYHDCTTNDGLKALTYGNDNPHRRNRNGL